MKKYFVYFVLGTFLFLIVIPPANAYAGPGVAIGAIIVAGTVILAFFGSVIIRIFNLLQYIFRKLKRKFTFKSKKLDKKSKQ